jgi:DNA-damage-inducible protein D
METQINKRLMSVFEQIKYTDENENEFWMARQLAKALEYTDFRNFISVIEKAKDACRNSGQLEADHLVEFNEEINHGKGAVSSYPSYKLSRYACYLIVQNADPNKQIVALGPEEFTLMKLCAQPFEADAPNRLS